MISRAKRGLFSDWWWSVDKLLLAASLFLMAIGLLLSFSSTPPIANRLAIDTFHFVKRHMLFLFPAMILMIGISFLDIKDMRRFSFWLFGILILSMLCLPLIGFSAKGSTRWLSIGSFLLQPSEFLKPVFVIVNSWLFSESVKRPDIPCYTISIGLLGLCIVLLIIQPDFGQAVLLGGIWISLFFMAGIPWMVILTLLGFGACSLVIAYFSFNHVSRRIDLFLIGTGDNYQVQRALEAVVNGGWFGLGPGEGITKNNLPDCHTDFVFSVAVEEFGILLTILLVSLFAFIVLRSLFHSLQERDHFVQLALSGLSLQFGFQALINMSVSLRLMPAKGMTLPFVSYGGSSLLAIALGMGFILCLSKKRADSYRRIPLCCGLFSNPSV
ncbi:putative peptidoglycan glycosyltransferase FtsW [Candidatus Endowatersipora endosymbiont of Watersipora subatra]|uniref:FtsW/RodA/SpoVE family cell cycle protein n=1 Tax=Candidatus Endowatersipora endosymbiont of Watersipora subatra TaxID=3077946 RepID=UPI00312C7627